MAQVLRQSPPNAHPDLIVGNAHFDDAGVFRLDERTALVQTVDFFPPIVDDPYMFGQIAAANALSDVYAMGGTPLTALNIVGFPDEQLGQDVLVQILQGGHERVTTAGAVIVGGHSVRDAEIKYGLAVTGRVDPRHVITNAAAGPGDHLVLTKPIGSGVLTSAVKMGLIEASELTEALAVMIHLNQSGRDAMLAVGARAATDITGFGLVGHAFEMAQAGRVTLHLDASAVPLMYQTLELAGRGALTRSYRSTLQHLGPELSVGTMDSLFVNVLCDAQTSGGLLISVSPQQTDVLLEALRRLGSPCAAVVGHVEKRGEKAICLR